MTIPNTVVADIMTHEPIVVTPETSLKTAIQLIANNRIGCLPVINDDKKIVGIISDADLMWQETGVQLPAYIMILDSVVYLENPAKRDRDLHKALGQLVKDVMTKPAITSLPDKPLREAAQIMHNRKIHHLPVVNNDEHVVGILTLGDIVRFMAAHYDD